MADKKVDDSKESVNEDDKQEENETSSDDEDKAEVDEEPEQDEPRVSDPKSSRGSSSSSSRPQSSETSRKGSERKSTGATFREGSERQSSSATSRGGSDPCRERTRSIGLGENAPFNYPFQRRSPFYGEHDSGRERVDPACNLRDYLVNLREKLADFQEEHGLPRGRNYTFMSLGLALATETGRAMYAMVVLFTEILPIVAISSLITRYFLDEAIDIIDEESQLIRAKKTVCLVAEFSITILSLYLILLLIIVPLVKLVGEVLNRMLFFKSKKLADSRGSCSRVKPGRRPLPAGSRGCGSSNKT